MTHTTTMINDPVTRGLPEHLHALARQYRDAWLTQHGVRPATGRPCFRRLHGGHCHRMHHYEMCAGPGADHLEMFGQRGQVRALVCHPYPSRWEFCASDAGVWAAAHDLVLTVNEAPSWYYPGESVLVVYRAAHPTPRKRSRS